MHLQTETQKCVYVSNHNVHNNYYITAHNNCVYILDVQYYNYTCIASLASQAEVCGVPKLIGFVHGCYSENPVPPSPGGVVLLMSSVVVPVNSSTGVVLVTGVVLSVTGGVVTGAGGVVASSSARSIAMRPLQHTEQ